MGDALVASFAEDTAHELIRADPFRIIGAVHPSTMRTR